MAICTRDTPDYCRECDHSCEEGACYCYEHEAATTLCLEGDGHDGPCVPLADVVLRFAPSEPPTRREAVPA